MGRKDKYYSKSLHEQAYDVFQKKIAFGESKKVAIEDGTANKKIFSFSTYSAYWKHTKYFLTWVKECHPDCTTLKKARVHVPEWLQLRANQGLSAWTVHLEGKALGKLYGIKPKDSDYFKPPERHRADIKRSRGDCMSDKHFSPKNNCELVNFCRGTGLRRIEISGLRGSDFYTRDLLVRELTNLEKISESEKTKQDKKLIGIYKDALRFNADNYVYVRCGKGGRERISPIIGPNVERIVERMRNTPADQRVWHHINRYADIHSFRSDYANLIYKQYARPIEKIPYDRINKGSGRRYQSEVYVCRKDELGKRLDKVAMLLCSKALGHNRLDIVANNYLRNL